MKDPAYPLMPGKRKGTYRVGRQISDRQYDPKIDGWDKHKLRGEPSMEQLQYRLDDQAANGDW